MPSYRNKILIDRTIGFLISVVLAILARLVGLLLRRDHRPAEHPQTIAVSKFVGMGSIVYVGILCRALKKRFPSSTLYFITTKGCMAIASRLVDVDKVLTVDDSGMIKMLLTNISLIVKLWFLRPELYFDMEVYSSYSAIIANLSLARNRYGFYRKSAAYKKGLFTHLIFFNTRRHIAEIYRQMGLMAEVDVNVDIADLLKVYPEDEVKLSYLFEKHDLKNKRLILVNPNASDLLIERRWSEDRWAAYLDQATQRWPQLFFLLVGAPHERKYVSEIYHQLSPETKGKVINLAGEADFGTYLALIKIVDLVVTIDSGPVHIAAAFGKQTISLWGPGDPGHYAPLDRKHRTLYEPVYCSPCLYHADVPPCGGDNICMRNISVEKLLEATGEYLKGRQEGKL
jgi:ADP-heptose:LPS heptosyltransferase